MADEISINIISPEIIKVGALDMDNSNLSSISWDGVSQKPTSLSDNGWAVNNNADTHQHTLANLKADSSTSLDSYLEDNFRMSTSQTNSAVTATLATKTYVDTEIDELEEDISDTYEPKFAEQSGEAEGTMHTAIRNAGINWHQHLHGGTTDNLAKLNDYNGERVSWYNLSYSSSGNVETYSFDDSAGTLLSLIQADFNNNRLSVLRCAYSSITEYYYLLESVMTNNIITTAYFSLDNFSDDLKQRVLAVATVNGQTVISVNDYYSQPLISYPNTIENHQLWDLEATSSENISLGMVNLEKIYSVGDGTAAIAAVTYSISNCSEYSIFYILYRYSTTSNLYLLQSILPNFTTLQKEGSYERQACINTLDNKLTFTQCKSGVKDKKTTYNNKCLVPVAVYGVKRYYSLGSKMVLSTSAATIPKGKIGYINSQAVTGTLEAIDAIVDSIYFVPTSTADVYDKYSPVLNASRTAIWVKH